MTDSESCRKYKKTRSYTNPPPPSAHSVAFPSVSPQPSLFQRESSSLPPPTLPQKPPPALPCNEDILPVGRLMADRERYLTNPKPSDSLGNFTQNLSFFFFFFSLEGESIHRVNESGKSNSKRQWDLRWEANCTKVMPDWSRDP